MEYKQFIISEIIQKIIPTSSPHLIPIIAICGAADLGKSYLSNFISDQLLKQNITSLCLSLDSYLIDRSDRKEKRLSGYSLKAYDHSQAIEDLSQLRYGRSIQTRSYNHLTGTSKIHNSETDKTDPIIFEGLHTLNKSFMPFIDKSIFLFTEDSLLKKIRTEADLIKRKYSLEHSNLISDNEFQLYKVNIEPFKENADYQLYLKKKWEFELVNMGY